MARMTMAQAVQLGAQALERAGASADMARATAEALVLADAQGLASHGLSRVPQYAGHLRTCRVEGAARPTVHALRGAAVVVNAHDGLAFEACTLAVQEAIARAASHGVACAGVVNSHHGGVMVDHLRAVAAAGMVGLAFANAPAAMPAAGGRHPVFGTNPIAAIFPRRPGAGDPLMIDLSLSEVARGKLMMAAKEGRSIPLGWALDVDGQPTTDPARGMEGSMLPLGAASSPKGAMLALMIELLSSAVIGAHFSFEADTFFVDEGNKPRIGQAFIVIDPGALAGSGSYLERVEVLVAEMLRDDGVRLPGARREALRRAAEQHGIEVPDGLVAVLRGELV
ncbi:MAG: Ldh family oxidoreductase [Aquincola sp.]|nr:Ldh family oxidoreductase [Aquincola sp.]